MLMNFHLCNRRTRHAIAAVLVIIGGSVGSWAESHSPLVEVTASPGERVRRSLKEEQEHPDLCLSSQRLLFTPNALMEV